MPERYRNSRSDRSRHVLNRTPAILFAALSALYVLPAMSSVSAQTAPEPVATENTVRRTVTRTVRRIEADGTETIITSPASGTPDATTSTYSAPTTYSSPASVERVTSSVPSVSYTTNAEGTTTHSTTTRTYTRYPDSGTMPTTTTNRTYAAPVTTERRTETAPPAYRSEPAPVRTVTRTVVPTVSETDRDTEIVREPVRSYALEEAAPLRPAEPEQQTTLATAIQPTETAPAAASLSIRQAPRTTPIETIAPDSTETATIQPEAIQPRVAPRTPALTRNRLAPTSYDVPDVGEVHQILWSTLLVINEAQATGDYSRFMLILSPRMRSEVSAAVLPEHMRSLEPHRAEMIASVGQEPEFEMPPHLIADGRMRLRGAFRLSEGGVRFDLMYQEVNGTWLVDAIAFAELR